MWNFGWEQAGKAATGKPRRFPGSVVLTQESAEGALGQGSLGPVRGVAISLTQLPGSEAPAGARMSPKGNQLLSDINLIKV